MRYFLIPTLVLSLGACTTLSGTGSTDPNVQIQQATMLACNVVPAASQIAAALQASAKTQAQVLALTTVAQIVCAYLGYAPATVLVPAKSAG